MSLALELTARIENIRIRKQQIARKRRSECLLPLGQNLSVVTDMKYKGERTFEPEAR